VDLHEIWRDLVQRGADRGGIGIAAAAQQAGKPSAVQRAKITAGEGRLPRVEAEDGHGAIRGAFPRQVPHHETNSAGSRGAEPLLVRQDDGDTSQGKITTV
jgi:hypothetical protein